MKEPMRTYVGAAVFFERAADDGWSEDTSRPAQLSDQRAPVNTRFSLSQLMKFLLRNGRDKTHSLDAGG
jgi:hypothetical protein